MSNADAVALRPTSRRELRSLRLPKVATLDELCRLIAQKGQERTPLFVRHSSGIVHDVRMGRSWDELLNRKERGLSVTNLVGMYEPPGDRYVAARAVLEYHHAFVYKVPDIVSYVLTGSVIGRGGDGEPLLQPDGWYPVAVLDMGRLKPECVEVVGRATEQALTMMEDGVDEDCARDMLHGPWPWMVHARRTCGQPCRHGERRSVCRRGWGEGETAHPCDLPQDVDNS